MLAVLADLEIPTSSRKQSSKGEEPWRRCPAVGMAATKHRREKAPSQGHCHGHAEAETEDHRRHTETINTHHFLYVS
jgi:hypothetical protein